jgi:hypothetical protein
MTSLAGILKSPHIQIALATGLSIIILAYFSKRILPQPIGYVPLAVTPFIATVYGAFSNRYNNKIFRTWYWISAIFAATLIIILSYTL